MDVSNKELMRQARESLSGKWGLAVGTFVIYLVITGAIGSLKGFAVVISLIVDGPFVLGLTMFALAISRNSGAKLEQLFDGFQQFGKSLAAYLLIILFTFLWGLLLIVPGIIAALSYSQTFFILADNPQIGAQEAIERSKKMMYGKKWKFFCLGLRFLGWGILSVLTLGIGFLWLLPYINVSAAKFYNAIKSQV